MEMVESKWIGIEQLYTNLAPDGKDTALFENKQTKEIIFETKEFSLNHDELSKELAGDSTKQQKWKQGYDDGSKIFLKAALQFLFTPHFHRFLPTADTREQRVQNSKLFFAFCVPHVSLGRKIHCQLGFPNVVNIKFSAF